MPAMKAYINRTSVIGAFIVAICADAIEIGFGFFFAEGFASPVNDVMDVIVCIVLTVMLGWHIAFVPSFLVKLIPMGDFAPTWTIAVIIATRGRWMSGSSAVPPPPVIKDPNAKVVDVEAKSVSEK
jgi:hypothetical protein